LPKYLWFAIGFGILMRVIILVPPIVLSGDALLRYDPLASNLVSGHGFSISTKPPFLPYYFDPPGYPILLACLYWLTGGNYKIVSVAQMILELMTLFFLAKTCQLLDLPRKVTHLALVFAMILPFLPIFAATIMTEVPSTFVGTLALYIFAKASHSDTQNGYLYWLAAGILAGISLLIRADMAICIFLLAVIALFQGTKMNRSKRLIFGLVFLLALTIAALPWTLRNYRGTKLVRPFGMAMDQLLGDEKDYLNWLDTWVDDPKYQHIFWWHRLDPAIHEPITAEMIADRDERCQAQIAIAMAKSAGSYRGKPSLIFSELAAQARRERPVQTFVIVPIRRTALSMIRMPNYIDAFLLNSTGNLPAAKIKFLFYCAWIFFLLLLLVGLVHCLLNRSQTLLLVAMVVGRIALPFYSGIATEPRYMIQALPCCLVFAAVGLLTVRHSKYKQFARAEIIQ
jgi:4-amino-4-deoxy-L-arabinose transferase-like glycosyltransferase